MRSYGAISLCRILMKNDIITKLDLSGKCVLIYSSRSSQCSTTGVTKAVVCVILSVGWYI